MGSATKCVFDKMFTVEERVGGDLRVQWIESLNLFVLYLVRVGKSSS